MSKIDTGPRGSYLNERCPPHYSPDVLVGYWSNRRYCKINNSKGILPGMWCENTCDQHRTLSQTSYRPDIFEGVDILRSHIRRRGDAFDNLVRNTQSQVRFKSTEALKKNCTTTYTLMYDVLPKMGMDECLKLAEQNKNRLIFRLPEYDMMKSYGNLTSTGKRRALKCEEILDKAQIMGTTYGDAFKYRPKTE
ncbi:uncharacterized protein LOC115632945 [Scaptodrosophila lebanonensis]|uniref:Uncharacterized protein LOC115632945 n=1 Tax=Drosophila lebanonensis TaxID=7225 RepID=A0A6J2UCB2_DROLE|nr:uncharacterized protein LOC115632945 [Scaptodrosophila lebanonensis]